MSFWRQAPIFRLLLPFVGGIIAGIFLPHDLPQRWLIIGVLLVILFGRNRCTRWTGLRILSWRSLISSSLSYLRVMFLQIEPQKDGKNSKETCYNCLNDRFHGLNLSLYEAIGIYAEFPGRPSCLHKNYTQEWHEYTKVFLCCQLPPTVVCCIFLHHIQFGAAKGQCSPAWPRHECNRVCLGHSTWVTYGDGMII